ncbi:MAG: hypothetical protein MI743_01505 [Sneathiellales bacterium]|nr:hypothetical protein [Sneathiellales bacterium]
MALLLNEFEDLCISTPDAELDQPLSYMQKERLRQIKICDFYLKSEVFNALCEGEVKDWIMFLDLFLSVQLPLHIQDEQECLFPLLFKGTAAQEKKIGETIRYICKEHKFDKGLTEFVMEDLSTLKKGRALVNPLRLELNLTTLLKGLSNHAHWELESFLPLVEEKLDKADLEKMAARMRETRAQLQ